jgi:Mce-associated membrane protein
VRAALRGGAHVEDGVSIDDESEAVDVEALDDKHDAGEHDLGAPHDEQQVSAVPAGTKAQRRKRFLVFGVLPAVALILALVAGGLKWQASTASTAPSQVAESVRAASDGTIAILSYRPDTVEQDLGAARNRLTGEFLETYTRLTHDVVIPGAKQKSVTAKATVPAAALVTASDDRAVVMVFVDQTTTIGAGPPSDSASSVRVTLDKRDGRWLISAFDPV